jgi:hypothetical protein
LLNRIDFYDKHKLINDLPFFNCFFCYKFFGQYKYNQLSNIKYGKISRWR